MGEQMKGSLETGLGVYIDRKDSEGNKIHIGDTLEFDEKEWGGPITFVIELSEGQISHPGSTDDLSIWCKVIKKWDE